MVSFRSRGLCRPGACQEEPCSNRARQFRNPAGALPIATDHRRLPAVDVDGRNLEPRIHCRTPMEDEFYKNLGCTNPCNINNQEGNCPHNPWLSVRQDQFTFPLCSRGSFRLSSHLPTSRLSRTPSCARLAPAQNRSSLLPTRVPDFRQTLVLT